MSDAASEHEDGWVPTFEHVSPNDPIRLPGLIREADERSRQPIDLNYVAIPKDLWEDIVRIANHGR